MIKLTLLSHLKNASRACIVALLCCSPMYAMEPAHAMEQTNNQEVSAQEVSAVVALATLPQTVATIAVAHHATQQAPKKKFTCLTCGKNLASNQSLTFHQRTHTGEKPFKCNLDDCTYACTTKSYLTVHQRTHTGEKPFKCNFPDCTYACTTTSHLTVHQRKHKGEKPFTCDFPGCSCACTQKSSLARHQKTQHANKKRELDDNLDLENNKQHHPEYNPATETELEENLS